MIKRTKELWKKHFLSRLTITSLPLFLVGLIGSLAPLYLEPRVLGADLRSEQWIFFRGAYNLCFYTIAFVWADLPERIEERLFGRYTDFRKRWIAYGLSLSVYRLPLYFPFAILSGYHWLDVAEICVWYACENLVLGGPFLYFREKLKEKFSKQPQSP